MAWRLAQSLITLRDQVDAAYPNRSKISDGTRGDAAHQATASDHNPTTAGVVCALDLTNDPAGGFDAHALADRLLEVRHPDLKYLISNRRIAGAWSDWAWTTYTGTSDPHINHIHVSVGVGDDGQSQPPYDDTDPWNVTEGDDMLTEGDLSNLTMDLLGRAPLAEEAQYVGRPFSSVYYDIIHSPEYKTKGRLAVVAQRLEALQSQVDAQGNLADAAAKLQKIKQIVS